tara:strand:+ start:850 stop:2094 length:1245 start_codon:yes stop_codon:yes gene_type:complete
MSKNKYKYFWVIGGGILQIPLIHEVKKLNYSVIVTDGNSDCICKNQAEIFECIDIYDISKHVQYAKKLISNNTNICGVLAAGIDAHETMAIIAEYLNLPGVDSKISKIVSNKDLFRNKMKEIQIPVPKYYVIEKSNICSLENIINSIGYPLIVKNTSSSGSRGTKIFYENDYSGVLSMVNEAIKVSKSRKALIESLWDGSEHTVETLYDINGKYHKCFITDRIFDKTNGYALETGLDHPTRLERDSQKQMYELAYLVSKNIGINQGAAKFDMMMTSDGPRIIEMTLRLSGGFDCQYLVPAATGKNILKAAILTALGKEFDKELLIDNKKHVSISRSLWPLPGRITKIKGIENAKKQKGFEFIYFRYKVGDIVLPYTDCTKRVCFIIVSGKDYYEAESNMENIINLIKIDTANLL